MTDISQAIICGPGEASGSRASDRVYLVKVARPEISLIVYDTGRSPPGASPPLPRAAHGRVLPPGGELELTLGRQKHIGRAGTAVVVPPGNVHAFTSHGSGRAPLPQHPRPRLGFSDFLRAARTRGEDASFDSVDVDGPQEPGEGTVLAQGEGTTYVAGTATSVFKATRESTAGAFSLAEATIQPGTSGLLPALPPGAARLVLRPREGRSMSWSATRRPRRALPTSAPRPAWCTLNRSASPVRFLNLNTPGGWEDYIRDLAAATPADWPLTPGSWARSSPATTWTL